MPDTKPSKILKPRSFRVLRRSALALACLLSLSILFILVLPVVVSSDWARGHIEQYMTKTTGKRASLGSLSFSWRQGLHIKALGIGHGQLSDESFLVALDDLHADFSLLAALRKDVRLILSLKGLRLRLPYSDSATVPEPPAKPLSDALRGLFAVLRSISAPIPQNLDAHATIDMTDMAVLLAPPPGGKPLELRDASFKAEVQGIKTNPLTIDAGANLVIEDRMLTPLVFSAKLEGLTDPAGRMSPAQAHLTAKFTAPGLDLNAGGSLAKSIKVDLRARPGEVLDAVRPLAARPLLTVGGALALALTLAQTAPDRLDLGLVFFADSLHAANGQLGDKSVGPISLSLLQEAALDLKAETVRFPGQLDLKATSRNSNPVRWVGELSGIAEGNPRATLAIAQVHIVLSELLPAVRAFLPPGLTLGQTSLNLEGLALAATLPNEGRKPDMEARFKGLELSAARLRRSDASGKQDIGHAILRVGSANLSLPGAGPGLAEVSLSAEIDDIRIGGPMPLSVRQFSLPRVSLRMDNLAQDAQALFGITGKALLELDAQAMDIEARGKASIPLLIETTRLHADFPASKSASLNLEKMHLDVPLMRVLQPGKKTLETPLNLHASAPGIVLSGPGTAPALRGMKLDLSLGKALRLQATTSLDGPAGRDLRTEGALTLNAQHLMALASTYAPRQAKASGELSVDWKLAATLPAPPPGAKGKPGAPKKLSQTLNDLSFLHEVEAVLRLDSLSLDWPLAAAAGQSSETLRLRGFTTPRALRLSSRDGVAQASLTGTLAFGPMDTLPGAGRLTKPLRGLLTVNATQQGARSVQFSQALRLEGLDLDQSLSLMLDKLDTVLDRDTDRMAAVLEGVDASFSFNVVAGLNALGSSAAAQGLSGKGRMEAGAEARLTGGRSLALSARLLSPGLDMRLSPDLAVNGLVSSLRFNHRYSITPGLRCGGESEAVLAPLSEQVFDLYPAQGIARPAPGNAALGQLLRTDDARGAGGSLSLAQLKLKSAGLPLDIRDVHAVLDDSGPVPSLRSFRAGLLGGNILGSAMLRKSAGRYSMDADLAFTGIDTGRLLPEKSARDMGTQAEASGRVSLSVPLTPAPEDLLQRLTFRADITKIGPRTLERMLYALDPNEQNETIVQQRRLMGMGFPRHLRMAAAYGNLSLSGAVEVKGFQLDLPPVDRLSIANLPLKKQLAKPLAAVPGLIKVLDAASGTRICLDPAAAPGTLRVVQPTSQGASQ